MRAIPGISAKVVDESANPVPNGHGGLLILQESTLQEMEQS